VLRVRVLGDGDTVEAARAWFEAREDVATAMLEAPGQIEIGFRGDEAGAARLLAEAIQARLAIASYSPAATDLQELFLQVTDRDDAQRAEAGA
jgi:hypothetical protein